MADPVISRIADDIETALSGLTVAGGYQLNMADPEQARAEYNVPANLKPVVAIDSDEKTGMTQAEEEHVATFLVEVPSVDDPAVKRPPQQRLMKVWADVVKALMVDRYRNQLADDTDCRAAVFNGPDAVVVMVDVTYRCRINDLSYSASLSGG